jgi:hypothetical protein
MQEFEMRMLFVTAAAAISLSGAAIAQTPPVDPAAPPVANGTIDPSGSTSPMPAPAPGSTGAQMQNMPAPPATGAPPPATEGAMTPSDPATPPAPDATAPAADTSAAPTAAADPSSYPVCSKKVTDKCRNRGGK